MEYIDKSYEKHKLLYELCKEKQSKINKLITLYIPEPQIMGNLETNCQEIIDEQPPAEEQDNLQDFEMDMGEEQEEEEEDEVDPENPLFGLDERLRDMNLDEESLRILKAKLNEANHKVKDALEER